MKMSEKVVIVLVKKRKTGKNTTNEINANMACHVPVTLELVLNYVKC